MQMVDKMDWAGLKHEYRVDAKRLLPWEGMSPPFGGAWAVVRAGTTSLKHVNDPADEEELFICVCGRAQVMLDDRTVEVDKGDLVFIPAGVSHYIQNPYETDFHVYCIWWNQVSARNYLGASQGDKS
jgi:oxalate decarboxylase/phosphoglucose isomerase-like protein (cupin superfamily)